MPNSTQTQQPFTSDFLQCHDTMPSSEKLVSNHQEYASGQAAYYTWLFHLFGAIRTACQNKNIRQAQNLAEIGELMADEQWGFCKTEVECLEADLSSIKQEKNKEAYHV